MREALFLEQGYSHIGRLPQEDLLNKQQKHGGKTADERSDVVVIVCFPVFANEQRYMSSSGCGVVIIRCDFKQGEGSA